jgi:hypothetical protein
VKAIAKALAAGVVIEAVVGLLSAASFSMLFAVLLWPGFLITDYAYSMLGYQGIGSENFNWILCPAVAINVVLYALVYSVFRSLITSSKRRSQRA